jgi:hypothetical protein
LDQINIHLDYCKTLYDELQTTADPMILLKLERKIREAIDLIRKHGDEKLIADFYLLSSRMELVKLNISSFEESLDKALFVANNLDLEYIKDEVRQLREEFLDRISQIDRDEPDDQTILALMGESRFRDYLYVISTQRIGRNENFF